MGQLQRGRQGGTQGEGGAPPRPPHYCNPLHWLHPAAGGVGPPGGAPPCSTSDPMLPPLPLSPGTVMTCAGGLVASGGPSGPPHAVPSPQCPVCRRVPLPVVSGLSQHCFSPSLVPPISTPAPVPVPLVPLTSSIHSPHPSVPFVSHHTLLGLCACPCVHLCVCPSHRCPLLAALPSTLHPLFCLLHPSLAPNCSCILPSPSPVTFSHPFTPILSPHPDPHFLPATPLPHPTLPTFTPTPTPFTSSCPRLPPTTPPSCTPSPLHPIPSPSHTLCPILPPYPDPSPTPNPPSWPPAPAPRSVLQSLCP